MWCCKCQKHVSECVCPDIKERLASLGGAGTNVLIRICAKCGEHYSRCKCAQPEWKIPGTPVPMPGEGEKN